VASSLCCTGLATPELLQEPQEAVEALPPPGQPRPLPSILRSPSLSAPRDQPGMEESAGVFDPSLPLQPPKVAVLGCMAERLKHKLVEADKLVDVVCGPDAYQTFPGSWKGSRTDPAAFCQKERKKTKKRGEGRSTDW